MSTHDVAGARLDYDVRGDGPLVVQLHGLTSSRSRDEALRLNFTSEVTDRRVARFDARGHGRSTGRGDPDDYRWPNLAADLLSLLGALSPDAPVAAVGQSMGCATTLHAAVRHPERFSRLVLALPPTAWGTRVAQSEVYQRSADLIERQGLARWTAMSRFQARPPAVDPAIPVTDPDVGEDLLPWVMRGAAESDLPAPHLIETLSVPTLILAWEDDASHPLSTARSLAALLPQGRMVLASRPEQVRHWPALVAEHLRADLVPQ